MIQFPCITALIAKASAILLPPAGPPGFIVPWYTVQEDPAGAFNPANPTIIIPPIGTTHVTIGSAFAVGNGVNPPPGNMFILSAHWFRDGAPTDDRYQHRNLQLCNPGNTLMAELCAGTQGTPQKILRPGEQWSLRIWNMSGVPINAPMGEGCWATFKWDNF